MGVLFLYRPRGARANTGAYLYRLSPRSRAPPVVGCGANICWLDLGQNGLRGLRRSASRHRLQARDAFFSRRVRAEEPGDAFGRKRVDDEQVRGLRVAGMDRNLFAPAVNLAQRAGERERVVG